MTFERSTDYPLLDDLLRSHSAALYRFLADDFAPPPHVVEVVRHPAIWYILARDAGELLGFWMFVPDSAILWNFHTAMRLDRRALRAMRELLGADGWLWRNTPCLRAATAVPASNPIALRFGLRAGLTEFGRNPRSYMKNGELQDLILLGISTQGEI